MSRSPYRGAGTVTERPGLGLGIDPAPWLVLGLVGTGIGLAGLVWLGGTVAALLSGHGWHPPGFGFGFAGSVVHGRAGLLWPATAPTAIWISTGVLAAVAVGIVTVLILLVRRQLPTSGDPVPSLARPVDVDALAPDGVTARAKGLRPSLRDRKTLAPKDAGVPLGELVLAGRRKGPQLRASWEDVLLAIMAPRAGKTTALAVPAVLEAPGAVIATSNKADLWSVTQQARSERGQVWVFDPQRIAYCPQSWWWNPLAGVTDIESAHRLAQHFVLARADRAMGGSASDFWDKAAHELLTALMLAAGCSGGTLQDVYEWLTDSSTRMPSIALERAGQLSVALSLRGIQTGAVETREGIYQTARTSSQALRDPAILQWVMPPPEAQPELDPHDLVASRDTLYLLSKDGAGSAAPLVAALTDVVFRAGVVAAEAAGGRLDPPLVAVLDEAANICRIADLPDLYSHLGSRGVVPVTILQSYKQGVRVWGEPGMDALWSASTVKVIGAGIDDAKTAEDLSRLVGEHDVPSISRSRGRHGYSENSVVRRERILGPEDIRALPRGSALLLVTGARAAMLRLRPWYAGPSSAELRRAQAAAEGLLRDRAVEQSESHV